MKKLILFLALFTIAFSVNTVNAETKTTIANYKNCPMCKLIQKGDFESVKSLVEAGANVNEKANGMTPLMYAARYNKVAIVKLLLDNGADIREKSDKGYTALKYAEISKAHDAYNSLKEFIDNN